MADSAAQRLNFCKKRLKKYTGEPKLMRVDPLNFLRHDLQCDPDSLKRAAQFFELDYTDPDDFTVLVNVLAEIVFGPRPRGRKTGDKIWDRQKFFSLGVKYNELKSLNPKYRDTKIAELISQDEEFKEYRYHPDEIRKRLAEAQRYFGVFMTGLRSIHAPPLTESQQLQQLREFKLDEKSRKRISDFTPRFAGRYITAVSDESNEDEGWMPRDALKCLGHAIWIQMRKRKGQ